MGEAFSQPGSRGGAERRPLLSPREPGQGAGRGSFVPCPTCRGSGEIPQEREKQLVALIPYGDQRLEPRRTKLFVFLAVLLCLVTAGFAFFFLFPRSISVHPAGLNSSTVAFDKATIHLNATSVLNISNPNYCPVTVTQLTVQALHVSLLVGQLSESLLLPISPLASDQVLYTMASRISDETTYKICTWPEIKVHYVVLHIQGTLTTSYLGHEDQHSFEGSEYVDCRRGRVLELHPP
ncbi:transmembrane protein 106A isoform X2 [Fukomys damarensis]|uniref:Transmembrane protein 106A n=1 Tax=Fukomys damarensis TaxID=885580 RepID=A0A091D4X1_FUKDA|nr:transmembrane protein 106A isoform X2 [Fukomys damarensis]KFO25275.1 Transmembrane protein 106A [Fukomys damarensis]